MEAFNASASNSSPGREHSLEAVPRVTAACNRIQPFASATPPKLWQVLATNLGSAMQRLRASLVRGLSHQGFQGLSHPDQPQVKWWRDPKGQDHYSVYDPYRRQTHEFATAHEVRVWLEQRYYE